MEEFNIDLKSSWVLEILSSILGSRILGIARQFVSVKILKKQI